MTNLSIRLSADSFQSAYDPDVAKLKKAVEEEDLGHLSELLQGKVNVNCKDGSFAETTLHKAVMKCWGEGVQTLLTHGAKVFTKNHFGQTPLHYAAASGSLECTRLLLQDKTGGATSALNHRDMRGRTPLHDAAEQKSADVAQLLIKHGAMVNVTDTESDTPLHKAAKAKTFTMSVMVALLNGGASLTARDSQGDSVLSYILRRIPGGMEALFDSCLVTNTGNLSSKSLEVKFNFVSCVSTSEKNQMKCLWSIVEYGHAKLLKHPLCEAFLHMKWLKVKKFFYIQFVYYFLYALLTTLLTFDKFLDTQCPTVEGTSVADVSYKSTDKDKILNPNLQVSLITIVVIMAVIILIQIVLSIVYTFSSFRFSFWNILHFLICVLVFLVLPFETENTKYFQQHLATILLLLLWIQCMMLVGRIPACGIYVVMFTRVAAVFVRIFAVYASLLLAFTFSFHISEHTDTSCNTPVDVFLTFIKTLTMMIGELDYDDKFIKQLKYLPVTSHVIFIMFVILVAVILSNLLVALAVSDVQSLRNSAHLERLIKQMELVFEMEQSFFGMSYLLELLRLHKVSGYIDRVTHYDIGSNSVTMMPYDPQKSNYLTVVLRTEDSCYRKHEKISIRLMNSVLDCLRHRDTSLNARKPSYKPSRLQRLRSNEYNTNTDEMREVLKDLVDRVSELSTTNGLLVEKMTHLETEMKLYRPLPSTQKLSSSMGHLSLRVLRGSEGRRPTADEVVIRSNGRQRATVIGGVGTEEHEV